METLFGLQMQYLAAGLAATLLILILAIGMIAIRNRFLIKLSLRNIPRRRTQSILIIVGLMLASTIVAASLAIGDTMTASIRNAVLDGIGDIDITISKPVFGELGDPTISAEEVEEIANLLYDDERVDGIMPINTQTAPVLNQRTRLTEARAVVRGHDVDGAVGNFRPQSKGGPSSESRLSPFLLNPSVDGESIDFASLGDDEVLINESLGNTLDAQAGDVLTIVTPLGRFDFRLRAIMQIGGMAANDQRVFMPLTTFDRIYDNEPGTATRVDISLDLDNYDLDVESEAIVDDLTLVFSDAELAAELHAGMQPFKDIIVSEIRKYIDENSGTSTLSADQEDSLNEFIAEIERDEPTEQFRLWLSRDAFVGLLFSILSSAESNAFSGALPQLGLAIGQLERLSASAYKTFLTEIAEQVGNIFFTFFTFFGSFSVIVGLLLIFLIFVLLASERQQEMGIARAVGTKRGHLVQMFTFEGLAYAIGAAAVGTAIGIVVSRGLVVLMANAFGATGGDGFAFSFSVTVHSIIVAFCIGLILTLITVIFSAYRVSKLNIVVAIRNLPEEFVPSTTKPLMRRILEFIFWIFGPIYTSVGLIRSIRQHKDVRVAIIKLIFTLLLVGWALGLIAAFLRIFSPLNRFNGFLAARNLPKEYIAPEGQSIPLRILEFVLWIFRPIPVLVNSARSTFRYEDVRGAFLKFISTLLLIGWAIGLIAAFFRIITPYFRQGWPIAIVGIVLATFGFRNESAWQAYGGVSLTVYGVAMLALALMIRFRLREAVASRISYTVTGLLILIIWAMPQRYIENVTGNLDFGIEMFILAGFFMVSAAVWVVMYNSDIIVRGLQATFGRSTALRPILKPAVAYAVANRFRTGLTVAMFALVIFVLMSFSILNQSFNGLLQTPENVTGGFDVRADINDELPIDDIDAAIDASPDLNINDFTFIAGQSYITAAARQVDGEEARYLELQVRGTEPGYFRETQLKITAADPNYLPAGTDLADGDARARAVWDALAEDPTLVAITSEHAIDFQAVGPNPTEGLMKLEDVDFGPDGYGFNAKEIEIVSGIEADTADSVRRTVIAVIDDIAESIEGSTDQGPPQGLVGIYTDHSIFSELTDEPVPFTIYRMNLAEGVDASRIASTMQTVFLDHSMEAVSTEDELGASVAQNEQFSLLFQGFMGLGLVVGVAALGVLSLRAVNERRMQIAIMRAIGYRGVMIRIQFIMESIFITVIGTGLGMGLGALLAWSFLDDIGDANQGLVFEIPWLLLIVVVGITITAALITTYVPARQASKVYPAEALRYE